MENKIFEGLGEIVWMPLNELKPNTGQIEGLPANPRTIKDKQFEKLIRSILVFPKMLALNPVKFVQAGVIIGGNQRRAALFEIVKIGVKKVKDLLEKYDEFKEKPDEEKTAIVEFWKAFINDEGRKVPAQSADNLTLEEKKEFIVKDNVNFGDHDWDALAEGWDIGFLNNWGVELPTKKNTEILSELKYESIYYEPKENPNISLLECINFEKFEAKIKALDEYDLTKEQREVLKWFSFRFLKIDFESVANYYYFNADDEEKKAIERLRLVLTDNGLDGFIQDDILKVYEQIKD